MWCESCTKRHSNRARSNKMDPKAACNFTHKCARITAARLHLLLHVLNIQIHAFLVNLHSGDPAKNKEQMPAFSWRHSSASRSLHLL